MKMPVTKNSPLILFLITVLSAIQAVSKSYDGFWMKKTNKNDASAIVKYLTKNYGET